MTLDEWVKPEFFGRTWPNLPEHLATDLWQLEREGAMYTDLWVDELGDFRHTRLRLTEGEIAEFVRRAWAYALFLEAGSPSLAVDTPGIDRDIAEEADRYEMMGEGDVILEEAPYHCPAAFYGPHLERLVCGMIPERRETIAQMSLGSESPPPTLLAFDDAAIRNNSEALSVALAELISPDESDWVEQKAAVEEPRKIAREIAAFATSAGGLVIVGVENDGRVTGCSDDLARFDGIASKGVEPRPLVEARRVQVQGVAVVAVRVYRGDAPVYYVDNRPYLRDGTTSRPASPEEVQKLILARKEAPKNPPT